MCVWVCEYAEYERVLPERSVIAEVSLVVAPLTFVLSVLVSRTLLTQRWRITRLVCSGDTARIEEICHT